MFAARTSDKAGRKRAEAFAETREEAALKVFEKDPKAKVASTAKAVKQSDGSYWDAGMDIRWIRREELLRNPIGIRPDQITVASRDDDGFILNANGVLFPAKYEATYGYQGFGKKKRKVRFPAGSIRVYLSPTRSVKVFGLDEAKQRLANAINNVGG